jgi:mono/diheme cytochrome c family protein
MGICAKMTVAIAAAAVCVGSVALSAQQSPAATTADAPQAAAKGNVENGKALYVKIGCYACHGYAGQGGAGARLAPNPIALPAFTRYIRRPTNVMPPYTEKLATDQQLADIHAYLTTLPPRPDPATIPLLQMDK